jgi:hypothetical protein
MNDMMLSFGRCVKDYTVSAIVSKRKIVCQNARAGYFGDPFQE